MKIRRGDFVALMGPSGSGKSTLMNILGCLDRPTSGEIILDGQNLSVLNDNQLAEIRNKKIGFVFQTFNLIPNISALKNVSLAMIFAGVPRTSRETTALGLLRKMGLENWAKHLPSELSGGQQQRIAIARSLANNPSIILADEPTGNLDRKTGEQVMQMLSEINKEGKTIILVTHDPELIKYTNRVFNLLDGEISEDKGKISENKTCATTKPEQSSEIKKRPSRSFANQPSESDFDPFVDKASRKEDIIKCKESRVEEIWINNLKKKKEPEYLADALDPKTSKQGQKTDSKDWFNGTEDVRCKVDSIIRKTDTKAADRWFEGEKNTKSKVYDSIMNKKKKQKHFSWSSVGGG